MPAPSSTTIETDDTSKVADNKQVVYRYFDQVLNGHNLDALEGFLAPDFDETLAAGTSGVGRWREFTAEVLSGFPELQARIEYIVAEDDSVAVRWTADAIHAGTFFGMPATGRVVPMNVFDLFTLDNGRVKSVRSHPNNAIVLHALGVIPDWVVRQMGLVAD